VPVSENNSDNCEYEFISTIGTEKIEIDRYEVGAKCKALNDGVTFTIENLAADSKLCIQNNYFIASGSGASIGLNMEFYPEDIHRIYADVVHN